ncbi:MAG: hypothetical protein IT183_13030 [Acidobacteria bacterium]|nr:hypothetical protein [Acidobacteriota bacterium]
MRRPSTRVLIALIAAATVACGSDTPTTPTPTPTPTPVTETFTGTLTVNGAVTFAPINISQAGSANATLKALEPRLVMRVEAGGTGNFVVGETAYMGESLDTATSTTTVYAWNPATRSLFLNNLTGVLPVGTQIVGATSGARWTNADVTTTAIGLALGTWSGTTCTIVLANDITGVDGTVTGVVQGAGTLCARVYDVGRLETPAVFTISVSHF